MSMFLSRLKMAAFSWLGRQDYFFKWLHEIRPHANFFLVQIGANDGITDDPVHSFVQKWKIKGLLVEPNPAIFEKLKETYRNDQGLVFENVAISDKHGHESLWCYLPPDTRQWHSLISTLEPGKGFSSVVGDEHNWKALRVETIPLDELLNKHRLREVDLLVIDTEGHDFKILSSFSFSVKPAAIYYEHSNISYNENFRIHEKLISLGYRIFVEKSNTLALLKKRVSASAH